MDEGINEADIDVGEERNDSELMQGDEERRKKRSSHMSGTDDNDTEEPGKLKRRQSSMPEPYLWDSAKHGPNLTIVEDQPDTVRRGVARQHTDGVRGSVGYNKGRHTFKFTFNDKPWGSHCAIGVCSQHSKLSLKGYQHIFGCDAMSWAWDIPSGCLLHAGQNKQIFADKMNIKVIYMTLDMNRGVLYFQPKGMDRFQAFTGLRDGGKDLLYPCASLVYGMAEVRISLKHSVFPSDKLDKRLSKRSSKSMERKDSRIETKDKRHSKERDRDTKEKKRSKERENERVRQKSQSKENSASLDDSVTENKDVTIEKKVSFKVSDNEDTASQKSTASQENAEPKTVAVVDEDQRSDSSSRESVKATDPLITRYAEDYQNPLAPVDEPVMSRNNEQPARTQTLQVAETDVLNVEQEQEAAKSGSDSESDRSTNDGKTPDGVLEAEAPPPADYTIEKSVAPDGDYSSEEEETDEESEKGETSFKPGNGTLENMYLKRHLTKEHELFTLQRDGTIHKEFITEKQRTDVSRPSTALSATRPEVSSDENESEQESGAIPEPVSYLPIRETTPVEKEESAAISSYRKRHNHSSDEQFDTTQRYSTSQERFKITSELPRLIDEEEPEDAVYTRVDTLNADDQYGLHVAHGWDNTAKGGGIQLYPNVPYIAIPIPRFQSRVQSVRSKRGFKSGIHKWHIRELPFYSPNLETEEDIQCSGIHIGVVSEEYRNYNQGFCIHDLGRFAWSWDSASGSVWEAGKEIASQAGDQGPGIDLHTGITLTLNLYKHKVTLTSGSSVIIELNNVRGKEIFPYVLFNQKGLYSVEIKYLEGPDDYLEGVLNELQTKDGKHREERSNYLGLTREISTKSGMVSVQSGINSAPYEWGVVSNGVTVSWGKTVSMGKQASGTGVHHLAIAQSPLYGGRHKIEFETSTIDNFVFGLVSDQFDKGYVGSSGPVRNRLDSLCTTTLGNNRNSWGWEPRTKSLFHGGGFVGKFPSRELDINWRDYKRLRMIVDFGHNGYNIVSFRAITERNVVIELGIAFVNLPNEVWPAVAIQSGDDNEKTKLHMDYVAGPKDFITDMKSGVCTLL